MMLDIILTILMWLALAGLVVSLGIAFYALVFFPKKKPNWDWKGIASKEKED